MCIVYLFLEEDETIRWFLYYFNSFNSISRLCNNIKQRGGGKLRIHSRTRTHTYWAIYANGFTFSIRVLSCSLLRRHKLPSCAVVDDSSNIRLLPWLPWLQFHYCVTFLLQFLYSVGIALHCHRAFLSLEPEIKQLELLSRQCNTELTLYCTRQQ